MLDHIDQQRLGGEARVSAVTLRRALKGLPIQPGTAKRIQEAAAKLGIELPPISVQKR